MATIAPVLPLSRDERFGVSAHTSIVANAKQNLLNLLLTNPGERIDVEYGVGLRRFLFENITEQTIENIKSIILSQASTYLANISILNLVIQESTITQNGISISITFSVAGSSATTLEVSV